MCVIAYVPNDKEIPLPILEDMWETNDDGAGYMYAKDGKIKIKKGFFKLKDFLNNYTRSRAANPDADYIVHFRISTGGVLDEDNCHPHRVSKDMAFVHNGVLTQYSNHNQKTVSDTVHFNNEILKNLPEGWGDNDAIKDMMSDFISYNKLVFLESNGNIFFINEEKGVWDDGIWFSNTNHNKPKITRSKPKAKPKAKAKTSTFKPAPTNSSTYKPYSYDDSLYDDYYKGMYDCYAKPRTNSHPFSEEKDTGTSDMFMCAECGYLLENSEKSSVDFSIQLGSQFVDGVCRECAFDFQELLNPAQINTVIDEYWDEQYRPLAGGIV